MGLTGKGRENETFYGLKQWFVSAVVAVKVTVECERGSGRVLDEEWGLLRRSGSLCFGVLTDVRRTQLAGAS